MVWNVKFIVTCTSLLNWSRHITEELRMDLADLRTRINLGYRSEMSGRWRWKEVTRARSVTGGRRPGGGRGQKQALDPILVTCRGDEEIRDNLASCRCRSSSLASVSSLTSPRLMCSQLPAKEDVGPETLGGVHQRYRATGKSSFSMKISSLASPRVGLNQESS